MSSGLNLHSPLRTWLEVGRNRIELCFLSLDTLFITYYSLPSHIVIMRLTIRNENMNMNTIMNTIQTASSIGK